MGNYETADVAIIGGGVIGLALARALARRGAGRVTVLERGTPGAEAAHAAGGMLAPLAEADKADAFMELACASRDLYPSFAAQLSEESGTDIALEQSGTLYLALNDADESGIARRYAWQTSAGLPVTWLDGATARQREPFISAQTRAALFFPRDWQVDNRLLVKALLASCERLGVVVKSGAEVLALRCAGRRVTEAVTHEGTIEAGAWVVAAGAWASLLKLADTGHVVPQVVPVRGQMLCFQSVTPLARHVIYSPRGYLIPRRDGRIVTGSTTEYTGYVKAVTLDGLRAVTTHAQEIVPAMGALPLVESWSGLRPRTADGWPLIGPDAEISGLYYATGHYRNGILLTPLTAELLAETIINGTPATLLNSFSPARQMAVGAR